MCSIFDAGNKGQGLQADEDIPAGSLVTEYIGEYSDCVMYDFKAFLYLQAQLGQRGTKCTHVFSSCVFKVLDLRWGYDHDVRKKHMCMQVKSSQQMKQQCAVGSMRSSICSICISCRPGKHTFTEPPSACRIALFSF